MNEVNKFPLMGMRRKEEPCEDRMSTKKCLRLKKYGKCKSDKVAKVCKKTCDICNKWTYEKGRLNPVRVFVFKFHKFLLESNELKNRDFSKMLGNIFTLIEAIKFSKST